MTGLCDLLPHSACSAAPWGPDSARTGHSPAANCEPAAAPVPTAALVWPAGSCPWHMGEDTRISAHGTPAWPAGSCPWHISVPVAQLGARGTPAWPAVRWPEARTESSSQQSPSPPWHRAGGSHTPGCDSGPCAGLGAHGPDPGAFPFHPEPRCCDLWRLLSCCHSHFAFVKCTQMHHGVQ